MSKYTPAPWQYCPSTTDPKKHSFAVLDEYGTGLIADVYKKSKFIEWGHKGNGPDPETTEANARLIAAAPELLETLIEIVMAIETGTLIQGEVDQAKKLIDKAKNGNNTTTTDSSN